MDSKGGKDSKSLSVRQYLCAGNLSWMESQARTGHMNSFIDLSYKRKMYISNIPCLSVANAMCAFACRGTCT